MEALIRFMADGLVIVIVLLGGVGFLLSVRRDRYQAYTRAILAGLTALVVAKLFSLLYESGARPFIEQGLTPGAAYLDNPGFPSDHALFVSTITLIVWATTKRKWLTLCLAILSLAVGVGRVLALVHTPLDVIGGVVAAFIGVYICYGNNMFSRSHHNFAKSAQSSLQ